MLELLIGIFIFVCVLFLYKIGYKAGSRAITNKRDKGKKSFQKRR